MSKTVMLKVTSAFLVGGEVARKGEVVEVTTAEAKDLLHRGKAELATAADEPKRKPVETEQTDQEAEQEADKAEQPAAEAEPAPAPKAAAKKAK